MDHDTKGSLISSADVNGTEVYGADRRHIGTIDHLMIDKNNGRVAYAVMGFGGFLGMGEEHYPVPWKKLSYDVSQNGFLTDITEEQVKGAPATNEGWTEDRAWEERTHQHYRTDPYWL